jgi:ribosome-binding factor A
MSDRMRKINELIREEASKAIANVIGKEVFLTVTAIETANDLKHAVIWISSFEDEKKVLELLNEKKSAIQHEITSKMYSKYTPKIEFKFDRSPAYVQRIDELLREGDE